jgi:hypothetical protein
MSWPWGSIKAILLLSGENIGETPLVIFVLSLPSGLIRYICPCEEKTSLSFFAGIGVLVGTGLLVGIGVLVGSGGYVERGEKVGAIVAVAIFVGTGVKVGGKLGLTWTVVTGEPDWVLGAKGEVVGELDDAG